MNNQISMFELLDAEESLSPERQKFRRALRHGPNVQGGKERIVKHAAELKKQEFAKAVAQEYGIGGSSFENGWIDFDTKGLRISEEHFSNTKHYSWAVVANEILDLISINSY